MNTKPGNAKVRIMIPAICILAIGLSGCAPREIVPAPVMLGGTCPEGMFEAGDGNCYANISCQDGYQLSNENPELVCVPESGDGPIVNPELGCSADQVFDDAGHCYSFDANGCIVGTAIVAGGWDCVSSADTTTDTDTNEADTNTDDSPYDGYYEGSLYVYCPDPMYKGDYRASIPISFFIKGNQVTDDSGSTTTWSTDEYGTLTWSSSWEGVDVDFFGASLNNDGENRLSISVDGIDPEGTCLGGTDFLSDAKYKFTLESGGGIFQGGGDENTDEGNDGEGNDGGGTGGQTNFDGSYTGDACGITGTLILNGNVIQDPDSGSSTYITIDEFGYASDWSWNGTLGVEEYTNVQFGAGAVTGTVYISGWGTCDFIGYRD